MSKFKSRVESLKDENRILLGNNAYLSEKLRLVDNRAKIIKTEIAVTVAIVAMAVVILAGLR